MEIPTCEEILEKIKAEEAIDNSPEQKALEEALAELDREIAAGDGGEAQRALKSRHQP